MKRKILVITMMVLMSTVVLSGCGLSNSAGQPKAKGSITGVVESAQTKEPLSGARVAADNQVATTNVGGVFSIDDLAAGDHVLALQCAGHKPKLVDIDVKEGLNNLGVILLDMDQANGVGGTTYAYPDGIYAATPYILDTEGDSEPIMPLEVSRRELPDTVYLRVKFNTSWPDGSVSCFNPPNGDIFSMNLVHAIDPGVNIVTFELRKSWLLPIDSVTINFYSQGVNGHLNRVYFRRQDLLLTT